MTIKVESGPTYHVVEVDLGVAHNNEEVYIPGDRITVVYLDGSLTIRLEEPDNPPIDLTKVSKLDVTPLRFRYIYFTNTAQSGKKAILYIGREASFSAVPVRAGIVGLSDVNDVRINPATEDTLKALIDDTIKGVLRSIGDAGDSPANVTGYTVLKLLDIISDHMQYLRRHNADVVVYSLLTSTPLGANAEYTSVWIDLFYNFWTYFMATVYSDVDGTLYIEQSPDSTNVDREDSLSYTGGSKSGNLLKVQIMMRYVRVRYVNGATAQTVFRLGRRWSEA